MSDQAYQRSLGNLIGSGGLGSWMGFSQLPDRRTDREKLLDRKDKAINVIINSQNEIKEIEEALELMDKHPMIERLNNLIKKWSW